MSDDISALLEEMREIRKALTDLEKMARQQAYKNSFLRLDAVLERTGLSRPSIYRLMAEGKFPKPIKPQGLAAALWPAHAIDAWIERVIAQNEGQTGVPEEGQNKAA